jgi:hypothetical protein
VPSNMWARDASLFPIDGKKQPGDGLAGLSGNQLQSDSRPFLSVQIVVTSGGMLEACGP